MDIHRIIKQIKIYKGDKTNNNKKMVKKELREVVEIEYENDCYWRSVALSTSKEGMQFRLQNKQIDFHKCRFACPQYDGESCCDFYTPLSQINLVAISR
jgi:hypothetical protein